MLPNPCCHWQYGLFVALLALVLILTLIFALVLLLILALIFILVIHGWFLLNLVAEVRRDRMPHFSGLILGLEQNSRKKSKNDGGGDAPGGGFQAAGKNAQKTLLVHRLPDPLGQGVAEAR